MTFLIIVSWPILIIWVLIGGHGLAHRLGFLPKSLQRPIWIHSASVGEAGVAAVLRDILHEITPNTPVMITSTTKMGCRRLEKILTTPDNAAILPFDHPLFVAIAFHRVDPRALIIVETELWPNLILTAKRRRIPIIMANGRISATTLKWSRRLGGGFKSVVNSIDNFLMKSDYDARNLVSTGVPEAKIEILGNLKFSALPGNADPIDFGRPSVVFGSIRPKEYESIINVCCKLAKSSPETLQILAPRHLKTVPQLISFLEKAGLKFALRSQTQSPPKEIGIYIIDTMGELLRFYASAQIAFVGGTLEKYGGHNPLEPAWFGIPVLFGEHIDSNREAYEALIEGNGGKTVFNGTELANEIINLLENPQERQENGISARKVVESMAGVREKYHKALEEFIES